MLFCDAIHTSSLVTLREMRTLISVLGTQSDCKIQILQSVTFGGGKYSKACFSSRQGKPACCKWKFLSWMGSFGGKLHLGPSSGIYLYICLQKAHHTMHSLLRHIFICQFPFALLSISLGSLRISAIRFHLQSCHQNCQVARQT